MALASGLALADTITVPKDTDVTLAFDQALSSKTAKEGDTVKLHVADDVIVGDKTIIKSGTPVTGVVSKVEKRKHFGVNAKMRITLNPVKTTSGAMLALEPREKGKMAGSKTGQAAGASAGGALLLGPVGLVGGYFVVGKPVNIKQGDTIVSTVSHDTAINWK
jgi:hypothetical protein